MRTIEFYRLANGASPIEDFLDSLNSKQAQKVVWVLRLIEELEIVPRQYFQKMVNTDDLWEVRVQFGGNIFRLLGFFEHGTLLIPDTRLCQENPEDSGARYCPGHTA
jgi:hypothetical protein